MDGGSHQRLRIAVLGPVRAWRDGTPLDLGPVRRQAVLATLVLRPGPLVSQEQLLVGVWGGQPPRSGRRVLPSYVYPLRKALDAEGAGRTGSVIRSGRGGPSGQFPVSPRQLKPAQRLDGHWLAAMGLCVLGAVHHSQRRCEEALACFAAARAHAETNGQTSHDQHGLGQRRSASTSTSASTLRPRSFTAERRTWLSGSGAYSCTRSS